MFLRRLNGNGGGKIGENCRIFFRGSEWKIEKVSNELKMIFRMWRCGGLSVERIELCSFNASFIKKSDLWVLSKHTLPKSSFFPLASPQTRLLIGLNFFYSTTRFSWIQFINYAKYILCTRTKKNLSHVRRYSHFFPSWKIISVHVTKPLS